MTISTQFLLIIGGILLIGLMLSALAQRIFLPRVTLLLLAGIAIGEGGLNLIPAALVDRFEIIAEVTLLMVGFLLGGKLTKESLRGSTTDVLWISVGSALMTAALVTLGLIGIGAPTELAVVLGCIASATAPAAVYDVVAESKLRSAFSQRLLSIVSIDDVWALMLFGAGLSVATSISGMAEGHSFMMIFGQDVFGAVLLGGGIGLPAAYFTGRIKPGQPILTEALGIVFICGGLANYMGVSYLIASIVMGAVVSNCARHHDYPFHAIEGIEWPFLILFFVLAGASLELNALNEIGLIGSAYVICRACGKYLGALLGSHISGALRPIKKWIGVALLPQAGVVIGMALVAANQFPDHRQVLLSVVITSTVLFEIIGPILTRLALERTRDT
jgi:Kef-type K+ transport system membrane component KefB